MYSHTAHSPVRRSPDLGPLRSTLGTLEHFGSWIFEGIWAGKRHVRTYHSICLKMWMGRWQSHLPATTSCDVNCLYRILIQRHTVLHGDRTRMRKSYAATMDIMQWQCSGGSCHIPHFTPLFPNKLIRLVRLIRPLVEMANSIPPNVPPTRLPRPTAAAAAFFAAPWAAGGAALSRCGGAAKPWRKKTKGRVQLWGPDFCWKLMEKFTETYHGKSHGKS